MASAPWSPAETDRLIQFTGDMPWPMVAKTYNAWARRHGLPVRSPNAIRVRADHLRLSRWAIGSWLTTGGIAAILGISPGITGRWMHRPQFKQILDPYRVANQFNRMYYIRRDRIRRFARLHPEQFGGIPVSNLTALLEDDRLAEQIAADFPTRPRGLDVTPRPVRCVETGRVFPSRIAAAREVFVTHHAITLAIRKGRPSAGFHWVDARQEAAA